MHRLPDHILITPTTLRRFEVESELEGGDGRHWACLIRSNGDLVEHDRGPAPTPEQRMFAHDMLTALNRHLAHDGAWLIVFTHHGQPQKWVKHIYRRFSLLWMDQDGDIRFPLECDRPIWEALTDGIDSWLQQCETAWNIWLTSIAALELKKEQTYKQAQGELAPTVRDPSILLH